MATGAGASIGAPSRLSTWVTVLVVVFTALLIFLAFVAFQSDDRDDSSRAAAPTTGATPAPQFTPSYHPRLDANGDPDIVAFPRTRPVGTTSAVPPVLFADPPGPDVIDPPTARAVVQSSWDARRDAIAQQRNVRVEELETGSALAIDVERACGCAIGDRFGPASDISVAVAHQHSYPASFFAQLNTTLNDTRWSALLVYTRSGPADPWRLAFAGGGQPIGNATEFGYALAADGFAQPAPTARPPAAGMLASFWQSVKDDGIVDLPAQFAPATLTSVWAATLVESRQGDVNEQNGLIGYYRFYADPTTDTYAVGLADGTVLQCSSIQEQKTWLPGHGDAITQPGTRRAWGPDVAPGTYGAVLEVSEYTPCFQYRPGIAEFQTNGVAPPDDIRYVGLAPAARTL